MNGEHVSAPASATGLKEESPPPLGRLLVRHEFHHLRAHWCWLFALGLLLVVCGTVAIVAPFIATEIAVDFLAAVLLIAGVATIVAAVWAGKWGGLLVQLLFGVLYIVAGFVITERPLMSTLIVTIFLAVTFIVGGAFRMLAALLIRFPQWGWSLLNGAVTALMGMIIFRHLPFDALWVVGLLVGVEMLLAGWTWIFLSLAVRNLPEDLAK
jgi:uncharacterized membrane protein HdeD (DUF308 family)